MKKRPGKFVMLYLSHPTPQRVEILRQRVKTWNFIDRMIERRLKPLKDFRKISQYIFGNEEIRTAINQYWKTIEKHRNRYKQKELGAVKTFYNRWKKGVNDN